MSNGLVPNPMRPWVASREAEVTQVNGRNVAKLPGRADSFPLFDYAWSVTLFNVDGHWHRLSIASRDSPERVQWRASQRSESPPELDPKHPQIAALELQLKTLEQDFAQKEKTMKDEIAALKAQLQSSSAHIPPPLIQQSSSPGFIRSPSTRQECDSDSASSNERSRSSASFPRARPSAGSASSATESLNPTNITMGSQHRISPRMGSLPIEALQARSGAPARARSAIFESASASPIGTRDTSLMVEDAAEADLISPRRTVHSMPVDASIVSTLSNLSSLSSDGIEGTSPGRPMGSGMNSPTWHSPSAPHSPHRIRISERSGQMSSRPQSGQSSARSEGQGFELPEERMWSYKQCEEWLRAKSYPSTDPNDKSSSGQRAIHCASLEGQTEVVAFLVLEAGADVNQKDLIGNSPLMCAASKGRLECVKWLLSNGAERDAAAPSGRTALHSAAAGGHLDVCQYLISLGSDAKRKEQFGKTASQLAEAYKHATTAAYLKTFES